MPRRDSASGAGCAAAGADGAAAGIDRGAAPGSAAAGLAARPAGGFFAVAGAAAAGEAVGGGLLCASARGELVPRVRISDRAVAARDVERRRPLEERVNTSFRTAHLKSMLSDFGRA